MAFAHAPGNQLRVLGAVIDYENRLHNPAYRAAPRPIRISSWEPSVTAYAYRDQHGL